MMKGTCPFLVFFKYRMFMVLRNRHPWFDTLQSYHPAVHRVKQALFHCAVVSDISTNPLPPPHLELTKYFEPPRRIVKRARDAIEECKAVFKVKPSMFYSFYHSRQLQLYAFQLVPKKIARTRKDGHVHAQDDDDALLLDRKNPNEISHNKRIQVTQASPSSSKSPSKLTNPNDSETEDEDEEEMLLDSKKPVTPPPFSSKNMPLPTPARSISPEINPGRAPGRIIGTTYPLIDFKKNLAQGDVVTKAVEDLGAVITEIVMKPFSSRRSAELLECMTALRDTSLKVCL
jgi:ATP-dependent DNA helicase 2 subunit 2